MRVSGLQCHLKLYLPALPRIGYAWVQNYASIRSAQPSIKCHSGILASAPYIGLYFQHDRLPYPIAYNRFEFLYIGSLQQSTRA